MGGGHEEDNEAGCHCSYLHFLEWKFFLSFVWNCCLTCAWNLDFDVFLTSMKHKGLAPKWWLNDIAPVWYHKGPRFQTLLWVGASPFVCPLSLTWGRVTANSLSIESIVVCSWKKEEKKKANQPWFHCSVDHVITTPRNQFRLGSKS